jgi:elongation factor 1-alpha
LSLTKINLVVVGHQDHGKSTLIGRLLYDSDAIPEQKLQEIKEELKSGDKKFEFAFILDSLEEERTGGLTIDIMHTPFKSKKYFYTIIDCPGHKEFIQKMLTGASQADAAVLVASAKEGIQDQTKEHLFLIKTLGIKQLVVAASKMDMIGYDEETFKKFSCDLDKMLSSLGYADTPIVPVSAFEGENVTESLGKTEWYTGKPFVEVLDETLKPLKPLSEKPLRCVVQDVYEIEGRDITVCKVRSGKLRTGESIVVMPVAQKGIVERIESIGKTVMEANPDESVGTILKGISSLKRGYILASSQESLSLTKEFVAELMVFADLTLRIGDQVPIRLGTAESRCRVQNILEKIDAVNLTVMEETPQSLEKGEVGKVLFRTTEPFYVEEYSEFPGLGRFVIVGNKGAVAAGIILEKSNL